MHKKIWTNSSWDTFISISPTEQIPFKPYSLPPDQVASFLLPLYVKKQLEQRYLCNNFIISLGQNYYIHFIQVYLRLSYKSWTVLPGSSLFWTSFCKCKYRSEGDGKIQISHSHMFHYSHTEVVPRVKPHSESNIIILNTSAWAWCV